MLESHRLGEDGRTRLALANVLVGLALGVLCAWIGDRIGARL
jgi:fluoride ion exporter CrcB/FEX